MFHFDPGNFIVSTQVLDQPDRSNETCYGSNEVLAIAYDTVILKAKIARTIAISCGSSIVIHSVL